MTELKSLIYYGVMDGWYSISTDTKYLYKLKAGERIILNDDGTPTSYIDRKLREAPLETKDEKNDI